MGTENTESSTLPDDVEALKALLRQRNAQIETLEHHVQVLTKLVFGPRSEKRAVASADRLQGHLFLATLLAQAEQIAQQHAVTATVELVRAASAPRPKARRKAFPDHSRGCRRSSI